MDDVTYQAVADAVMASFTPTKHNLGIDAFDRILMTFGEKPTGAGRKGRGDWNYTRNLIRKNLNTLLRRQHGVSLEVQSQSKTEGVKYHLVPLMASLLNRPLEQSESFRRRVFRHFAEINKAVTEEYPPPDGSDIEQVKAWEEFAAAKAQLLQQDYNLSLIYMARARGLARYLENPEPTTPAKKKRNGGT